MIKSVMEKHTVSWIKRNRNLLDFSIGIQRKEVWDIDHKSNLITAILIGVPIESILFEEEENIEEGYKVLDGKQRIITLLKFLDDDFVVSENCKIKEINGESIVCKKFSELSETLQETLKEYELSISVMRPLTEDERELVFFMRNQAIALTKFELTRVLMGSKSLDVVQKLVKHPLIEKLGLMSSTSYKDQQVVSEILVLETGEDFSFSGKDMMTFAENLKVKGISDENQTTLLKVFDYMDSAIEKRWNIRKIHIPMLYVTAKQAMSDGIDSKKFFSWMKLFFKDIKGVENDYNRASDSGVLQKKNIQARITFMLNHYKSNI